MESFEGKMSNLTVVILTKNEEKNIVDVIENAKAVTDKVLIVDSNSTDRTIELAEANGAKVVFRAWDNDFAAQRNFALKHINTDWVLYIDADERMNEKLIQTINEIIDKKEDKQYSIQRKSLAFGKEFNYGVLRPDFVTRLFKKEHVTWINKVHEKPICSHKLEVMNGYIIHYTYESWEQWLKKFNQYTSIWAINSYENEKRVSLVGAFGHALFGFIQMYIFKKGFLDGGMGLILSFNHFFYTLMKYLKLLELQRKGD